MTLSTPRRVSTAVALFAILAATTYVALAHSIDYVGMELSPSATINGGSGNWTVTEPLAPAAEITFDLKYQIVVQGRTTDFTGGHTVTFSASTELKPSGADDAIVTGLLPHTFTSAASTFTDAVTIVAPSTEGSYQVKVYATSGTGGRDGLGGGNGIVISFTVAQPTPQCPLRVPTLTVQSQCEVLLHQTAPVTLNATLTDGTTALGGRVVRFFVDGVEVGQATTDANGLASLSGVDASQLSVGDHAVTAYYDGDGCEFAPTNGSGNLGVEYLFHGFQQPINADGSSAFGGRTIPVKIRISDGLGNPVEDAAAHVFFAFGTPAIIGTEAEPVANTNGDSGNLMRYDPVAGQYVFNWDIAGLPNGTYTIRVDLGEGRCGDPHTAVVSLKKKGSK